MKRDPVTGKVYRTSSGGLVRALEVLEATRCSPTHLSSPTAVVVRVEDVGPGYGARTIWSDALSPASPGDRGCHPCTEGRAAWSGFCHRPASWRGGNCNCPIPDLNEVHQ